MIFQAGGTVDGIKKGKGFFFIRFTSVCFRIRVGDRSFFTVVCLCRRRRRRPLRAAVVKRRYRRSFSYSGFSLSLSLSRRAKEGVEDGNASNPSAKLFSSSS